MQTLHGLQQDQSSDPTFYTQLTQMPVLDSGEEHEWKGEIIEFHYLYD